MFLLFLILSAQLFGNMLHEICCDLLVVVASFANYWKLGAKNLVFKISELFVIYARHFGFSVFS